MSIVEKKVQANTFYFNRFLLVFLKHESYFAPCTEKKGSLFGKRNKRMNNCFGEGAQWFSLSFTFSTSLSLSISLSLIFLSHFASDSFPWRKYCLINSLRSHLPPLGTLYYLILCVFSPPPNHHPSLQLGNRFLHLRQYSLNFVEHR